MLLDFVHGRFAVLGLTFWAHDAPILFFVVGGAALSLAWATAVFGRVWCGWACPQTVFVDSVFRRIERWIEGDAIRRKQLDQAPWSGSKIAQKTFKWICFLAIALVLSHSFLAYFIGTGALGAMMASTPSANPGSFVAMMGITGAVLFDFGWFREQFCTLLCPYGRFQSVLMDEQSLNVSYDQARGEPRRGLTTPGGKTGDCVSCNRCVAVCPTGIDIRNGLQMECIACTACIDACDEIMRKVNKPQKLIRYSSKRGQWRSPRALGYLAILVAMGTGLGFIVQGREPLEITVVRHVGEPYQEILKTDTHERDIVNRFRLDLRNQAFSPAEVTLGESNFQLISPSFPLTLAPGEIRSVDLFVQVPSLVFKSGHAQALVPIQAKWSEQGRTRDQALEVPLVGPLR